MFTEISNVRQIKGEPKRRWFSDKDLELIVWFGEHDRIVGFQLCYEMDKEPRALTWRENEGFLHTGIDDGEIGWRAQKATPVLIRDGVFDQKTIGKRFASSSQTLPKEIADFVLLKIKDYP